MHDDGRFILRRAEGAKPPPFHRRRPFPLRLRAQLSSSSSSSSSPTALINATASSTDDYNNDDEKSTTAAAAVIIPTTTTITSEERSHSNNNNNEDDDDEFSKLEQLQERIMELNGGNPINCNSRHQVSFAVFGNLQSINREALQKAADDDEGDDQLLDPKRRELANLILKYRTLLQKKKTKKSKLQALKEESTSSSTGGDVDPPLLIDDDEEEDWIPRQQQHQHSINKTIRKQQQQTHATRIFVDNAFSKYEDQVEALFAASASSSKKMCQMDIYWKEALLRLRRPSARDLVEQLDSTQCPMGYDPLYGKQQKTTKAGTEGSFLGFSRTQKTKYPDCVVLTRCGDFYESFGIDAILLVEHCGLNAMADKAKAGCPYRNIQATLDGLTNAGFRVAVYEECDDVRRSSNNSNQKKAATTTAIKKRFLAQIVSSAAPTYLYDLILLGNNKSVDALGDAGGSMPRPYVGILSSQAGYTLVEVSLEERNVRISERLTAEAVACRLAAYPPADPLLYVPARGEYSSLRTSSRLPFLPSRRATSESGHGTRLRFRIIPPTLVQQEGGGVSELSRAKDVVVSELLKITESKEDDDDDDDVSFRSKRATKEDFTLVSSSFVGHENDATIQTQTQTSPLHLDTATQLGLMNDDAIPSLVSHILPESAPAAPRRFLRRLLLTPPPPDVGDAMACLVSHLKQDGGPALPPLSMPPIGKVLSMLRASQANALVFGELLRSMDSTKQVLDMLGTENNERVLEAFMLLLEYESGMAADPTCLNARCDKAVAIIEQVVNPKFHVVREDTAIHVEDSVSQCGHLIPKAFYERNEETWRGRVRRDVIPQAYSAVEEAAQQLADAVQCDFGHLIALNERGDAIVQDINNNLIAMKLKRKLSHGDVKFIHPRDRNGKPLSTRYTTERVEEALARYKSACDEACNEVSAALARLSKEMEDGGHIPAIVQASHANLILSSAFYHAIEANSRGWSLGTAVDGISDTDRAGHCNSLRPYWMDRSDAVANTFDLSGLWVLTAPNMSGKSTVMRATAAAALLTVCGLCAPFDSGSSIRRFDHIFVRGASSDVPVEHKSAFGAEMQAVASLLHCCGNRSLVFVDELGRGTSPRDGTRLAAAILEKMAVSGMSGIFATHLHDILKLPLGATKRIVKKRMAIHGNDDMAYSWTYRLEDGICTDSMALTTAKHFGLPTDVIKRAEALESHLPTTGLAGNLGENSLAVNGFEPAKTITMSRISKMVEETTNQSTREIPPGYSVPASFDGKSALYVLKLSNDRYYVGETDNLRKRLKLHRGKNGEWVHSRAIVVPVPEGKSQAREWESILIRKMASVGVEMQSVSDGRRSTP